MTAEPSVKMDQRRRVRIGSSRGLPWVGGAMVQTIHVSKNTLYNAWPRESTDLTSWPVVIRVMGEGSFSLIDSRFRFGRRSNVLPGRERPGEATEPHGATGRAPLQPWSRFQVPVSSGDPPITLGNMRPNGVCSLAVFCNLCRGEKRHRMLLCLPTP